MRAYCFLPGSCDSGKLFGLTYTRHVFPRSHSPDCSDCLRASSATGTDPEHRGGELRLDISEEALALRDEGPAIIPGKPMESAIIKRILDTDPDNTMPPPEAHLVPLKSEQIETLKTWIANGAVYEDHWAFETPVKAPFTEKLTTNPVDNFIRARLAKEGLAPSPRSSAGNPDSPPFPRSHGTTADSCTNHRVSRGYLAGPLGKAYP